MPANSQHLHHLSQLLRENDSGAASPDPNEIIDDGFFRYIALDRVRLNQCDWRGHAVLTLLWHLPDLKPARRAVLTAHVRDRWHAYVREADVPPSQPSPLDEFSTRPPVSAGKDKLGEPNEPISADMEDAFPPPQDNRLSAMPLSRRDWFDRFTDWVVAVISLFD